MRLREHGDQIVPGPFMNPWVFQHHWNGIPNKLMITDPVVSDTSGDNDRQSVNQGEWHLHFLASRFGLIYLECWDDLFQPSWRSRFAGARVPVSQLQTRFVVPVRIAPRGRRIESTDLVFRVE